ncbi:MAG: response regulator [Candidatus Binatia bacterium]|nr:response regulator [Candidatus Binatia bacterium]
MEKILVVDDDALCRKLVVKSLQKAGYETLEADSASAGLSLLQSEELIALVITDITMPEMDGLTFLSCIRNDPTLARLPVLICTGLNSRDTIVKAGHLGIAGYLLKPVDTQRLRSKVQEILASEPQPLADVQHILSRLDLEEKDYVEMLDELVERLLAGIGEMEKYIGQKDPQRLSTCLSALHGAAKSLGAQRVTAVLERQFHASQRIDFRTVQGLLGELRREIARLQSAAAKIGAETTPRPQSSTPNDSVPADPEALHA